MSMGNVLTFNIRCESADEVVEVLDRLTKAAILAENPFFFLSGDYPGQLILHAGRTHPERNSPPHTLLLPTRPFLFPHLSMNRESRPLTAMPGMGVASAFRRCAGCLTASVVLSGRLRWACCSSRCRLGSGFIPMTEGLWLIHVTEPVTETIS